jgi:hypothetical protein
MKTIKKITLSAIIAGASLVTAQNCLAKMVPYVIANPGQVVVCKDFGKPASGCEFEADATSTVANYDTVEHTLNLTGETPSQIVAKIPLGQQSTLCIDEDTVQSVPLNFCDVPSHNYDKMVIDSRLENDLTTITFASYTEHYHLHNSQNKLIVDEVSTTKNVQLAPAQH